MRRVTLSMAVVFAAACSGDVPVDEKVCEVACGVGFVCEAPRCVPSPETVIEVEVLAPVAGAWLSEADVTFQCRVKAPQVSRVLVKVTPADAEPTEVELTKVPAQDAWTGTGTLDEGAHEAICVVEFGPPGDVVSRTSEPVTFNVSLGAPVVTLDPIEGWFGAGSKVTVKATHSPGAQVESATLDFSNPPLHLAGVSDGANGWTFEVNVDSLSKEEVEAEFPFEVSLKDSAGNEGKKSGVIRVDTIKPKSSFTSESKWLRAGDEAEITLSVQDGGEIAAVTLSTEGTSLMGVLKGEQWSFKLPVDTLAPEGLEGELPYEVNVKDAAGNITVLSDKFLIDTIAPAIDTPAVSRWYGAGATALVWATVVEGYGVEEATLTFERDSTTIQGTHQGGQEWSFAVDVDLLAGGPMEASNPYEIVVADVAGNETKAAGALRVDNVAPKVTKESESAWVRAGETARVSVSVVEGGALASVSLSLRDKTFAGVSTGGKWEFSVPVEEVFLSDDEELVPYVVTVTDGAGNQATIDGTLGIDVVPPGMELKPLPAWVARSSTLTVKAEIVEGGEVDPASVILTMGGGPILGEKGDDNIWSFDIPLASVTLANVQGPVSFTVSAADRAGNLTTQNGAVNVDGTPPQVTVTGNPDATWRGTGTFNFTATVSSLGAPVVSSTLSRTGGGPSLTSAGAQSELTFIVKTADWQALGAEGLVPWTLKVVDAAGNETTKTGQFKIDRKPPSIDPKAPTAWFNTSTVPVNPVVTDGGSGPSTTFLEWDASGQRGQCSWVSLRWECIIATPLAGGTVSSTYPYTINAKDAVGNASSVEGRLKIDKKGPAITLSPDGKWYKRSETIKVTVTVVDPDSGFGNQSPVLTVVTPQESTHFGSRTGSVVTFNVPATKIVRPGEAASAVGVIVRVLDAVGNATDVSSNSLFRVDDAPPILVMKPPVYPSGRNSVAVRDPWMLGRSKARIEVVAADTGVGLSSVALTVNGGVDVPPTSVSGDTYMFDVDASTLSGYVAGEGEFSVGAKAIDSFSLQASDSVKVAYSRILWSSKPTASAPVGGLALSGDRVFASYSVSGTNNVYAIDRKSGGTVWSYKADGRMVTAPSILDDWMFVASDGEGGSIDKFQLSSGSSVASWKGKVWGVGVVSGALAATRFAWGGNIVSGVKRDWDPIPTVFFANDSDRLKAYSVVCIFGACPFYERVDVDMGVDASSWGGVAVRNGRFFVGNSSSRLVAGVLKTVSVDPGEYRYDFNVIATPSASTPYGSIAALALGRSAISYASGRMLSRYSTSLADKGGLSFEQQGSHYTPVVFDNSDRAYFASGQGGGYHQPYYGAAPLKSVLSGVVVKSAPVVGLNADGAESVYFADGAGYLNVFRVGTMQGEWGVKLDSGVDAGFVLDCKGLVYVMSRSGTIYGIVTNSVGLSRGEWPKFQHDNRNTGDANYKTWNGNTCID